MLPRRRSRLGRSILGSDRLCGRWRERPARELPAPPPRYDLTSIFFRLARSAFGIRAVRDAVRQPRLDVLGVDLGR
jgi:hypothetical protein